MIIEADEKEGRKDANLIQNSGVVRRGEGKGLEVNILSLGSENKEVVVLVYLKSLC